MQEQKPLPSPTLVADTAMLAGTLILENGGETYRAEETALYICKKGGIASPQIIALPTGIFFSGNQGQVSEQNGLMRIRSSSVHLYKLERTNAYCREYAAGGCEIEELYAKLTALRASNVSIPYRKNLIVTALCTGLFAIVFNGDHFDALFAFVAGLCFVLSTCALEKSSISTFSVNFIGGAAVALSAVLLTHLTGVGNLDIVIVSGCMPLVPGIATLNGVRDAMVGDLVSGNARLLKAVLIALSLAAGVGLTLGIYLALGGTI